MKQIKRADDKRFGVDLKRSLEQTNFARHEINKRFDDLLKALKEVENSAVNGVRVSRPIDSILFLKRQVNEMVDSVLKADLS